MPKKKKGSNRASSTPGRTKGENCHRSQMKNLHANDTRMYKKNINEYVKICKHINSQKGNLKSGWIEEYEKEQQK